VSELPDVVDDLIQRVEGGYSNDPDDPGNWSSGTVGVGTLIGTKYGISAAANSDVDIPNLTWPQAEDLYYARYWKPSGAADLWTAGDKALAVVTMDAALHSGVTRGRAWTDQAQGVPLVAVGLRLQYLTSLTTLWGRYHRGWTRRVAALMVTAGALDAEKPQEPPQPAPPPVVLAPTLEDRRSLLTRCVAALVGESGPVRVTYKKGDRLVVTTA